jgi:hypothetical protein
VKRAGHLFEKVSAFPTLLSAYERARQGKRGRPSVERFTRLLEPELLRLQEELRAGAYRPGTTVSFEVHDPKRRLIEVAPFRDRVVHHAVVGTMSPWLERGMDPDSYGCRVGKGTDGALARARQLARRHPLCLRGDVSRFFASVSHELLLAQIARLFKDRRLLALLDLIVRMGGREGRGLPIGHLTSQWFANLYLTPLDRFVRRLGSVCGYVRYMDDLVLFGRERSDLREARVEVARFLADKLDLAVNTRVTQVFATRPGFPFLGFRVSGAHPRPRRRTWRRMVERLRRREREFRRGRLSEEQLQASGESFLAHLRRADSLALRRAYLAREPPVVW